MKKQKLDKINIRFLNELANTKEGLKEIKGFEMMFLGGAWSEVSPFVRELVKYGSKLTLLDAYNKFKIKKQPNVQLINEIISDKKGKATFYETFPRDCSSLFEPNREVLSRYKFIEHVRLDIAYEVKTTTLKDLGEFKPNYVCLDLQGSEILALEGAHKTFFDNLYIITTESCFVLLYKRQPLFKNYLNFFKKKDYKLIDMGIVRKAHCIDLSLKINLGKEQLYTDLTFIKNDLDLGNLPKLFLSLLIEYRYSELYKIYEEYKYHLEPEIRFCLAKLFNKLK